MTQATLNDRQLNLQLGTQDNRIQSSVNLTQCCSGNMDKLVRIEVFCTDTSIAPYNTKYNLLKALFGSSATFTESNYIVTGVGEGGDSL